ncbi:MAG TPA: hypothetical protein H9883_05420 [Candidatus Ruthenibacterium merdigallinarum]|nr:hypothetical protein [Candidatus Ruthenibacterium merdigallinarum]
MQRWFLSLLGTSLSTGALIAVFCALRPLLLRRYTGRMRRLVWLILALRLLVVLPAAAPAALSVELPAAAVQPVFPAQTVQLPATDAPAAGPSVENAAPAVENTVENVENSGKTAWKAEIFHTMTPLGLLTGAWLLVALSLFGAQFARYAAWRRAALRWAKPADGACRAAAHSAAQAVGLAHVPPVYLCETLTAPVAVGTLRPAVLLPARLPQDELLDAALRHELAHIRRGDLWAGLLLHAVCALHWFNPAVWLLAHCARRDMEFACDEAVLAGRGAPARAAYGRALLACAGGGRAAPFGTGFARGKRVLAQRLHALLSGEKRRRGGPVLAGAALLAALTGGLVACGVAQGPVENAVSGAVSAPSSAPSSASSAPAFSTPDDSSAGAVDHIRPNFSYNSETGRYEFFDPLLWNGSYDDQAPLGAGGEPLKTYPAPDMLTNEFIEYYTDSSFGCLLPAFCLRPDEGVLLLSSTPSDEDTVVFWRSDDAGEHWRSLDVPKPDGFGEVHSLDLMAGGTCCIVSVDRSDAAHPVNTLWICETEADGFPDLASAQRRTVEGLPEGTQLYRGYFADADNGIFSLRTAQRALYDTPAVVRTTDGGRTWQFVDFSTALADSPYASLRACCVFPAADGLIEIRCFTAGFARYESVSLLGPLAGEGDDWAWGTRYQSNGWHLEMDKNTGLAHQALLMEAQLDELGAAPEQVDEQFSMLFSSREALRAVSEEAAAVWDRARLNAEYRLEEAQSESGSETAQERAQRIQREIAQVEAEIARLREETERVRNMSPATR